MSAKEKREQERFDRMESRAKRTEAAFLLASKVKALGPYKTFDHAAWEELYELSLEVFPK